MYKKVAYFAFAYSTVHKVFSVCAGNMSEAAGDTRYRRIYSAVGRKYIRAHGYH